MGFAAAFLAALLLASALHKAIERRRLAASAAALAGLPISVGGAALAMAGLAEAIAGLALLAPQTRTVGALLAAAVWGGYLLAILRALSAGRRDLDCGCDFGAAHAPLGAFQPLRNSVLIALALAVAAAGRWAPAAPVGVSDILAALAFLSLYAAIGQIAPLAARTGRP